MSDKNINKYKELCKQENTWFTKEEGEAFSKGCELAQKEMQEKLDAAIRAKGIACLKHDLIHYIGCGHCLDEAIEVIKKIADPCQVIEEADSDSLNDDIEYASEVFLKSTRNRRNIARDFLKARGE